MLLRCCNIVALRQVIVDLLAYPAAWVDSSPRIREAPLEVRHGAGISALLTQVRRIVEVYLVICSTRAVSACGFAYSESYFGIPNMGAPFPLPSIGCPSEKGVCRFTTPANAEDAKSTLTKALSLILELQGQTKEDLC